MRSTVIKGCRENLIKLAEELAYPAILLDKEYKIVYKNGFCLNRLIPLRMGSCIKKHLSSADFRRIVQMKTEETIRVNIELPALYGAFIYRGEECYLVGLRTLSAALQNRINELMKLNSDLTESLLCQMSVLSALNGEKGISELLKHKSNRIIRSQQHISEFLRIVNGIKNTRTHLCEVSPILDAIILSLRDALRPLGIQITYNNAAFIHKDINAMLCEPDFNMIICHMLNNGIRLSQSGKLQIDVNVISGKLYISLMTDTVIPENIAKNICESDFETESFSPDSTDGSNGPDGWMYFDLLLIRKLCEYYFWDIRLSAPGSDYSRLQLTLSLPLENEKNTLLIFKDSETSMNEIRSLIAIEFSDIFDR
ncbi:MAG: hypothetical protein CVU97_00375 [Firmicutes bacterium HGW-Firmicutes-21]|nr:MAG: hypothetical protein CVU97_00375 [Firmicutes bacterium HGW-Firmicutes-21]